MVDMRGLPKNKVDAIDVLEASRDIILSMWKISDLFPITSSSREDVESVTRLYDAMTGLSWSVLVGKFYKPPAGEVDASNDSSKDKPQWYFKEMDIKIAALRIRIRDIALGAMDGRDIEAGDEPSASDGSLGRLMLAVGAEFQLRADDYLFNPRNISSWCDLERLVHSVYTSVSFQK